MIDQYYVIGYPVKHSLSPQIHREFAQQTKQNMRYDALEICPDNLEQTLNVLRLDETVKGLSVTLPFKEAVYAYCDEVDELAQQAKAVSNVVIDHNRRFIGFNLDGLGLINDINKQFGIDFKNKTVLIVGAGGAAKGILGSIAAQKPRHITIANRTLIKAIALAESIQDNKITTAASQLTSIAGSFDIVINATSASVEGQVLPLTSAHFKQSAVGYDLMYAPDGTVFTKWCDQYNIRNSDGKGMLIELSKLAFSRWRGVVPE